MIEKATDWIYDRILSEKARKKFGKVVFSSAILLFLIEILLFLIVKIGWIPYTFFNTSERSVNFLSLLYAPFSLILIYEVYLLIFYLPKSITVYLGKQYEVIILIVIRGMFDLMSKLPFGERDLVFSDIKNLLITIVTLLMMLGLILIYNKLSGVKQYRSTDEYACPDKSSRRFVRIKKGMAILLVVVFVFLFVITLPDLFDRDTFSLTAFTADIKSLNDLFFSEFFGALIFTEVMLLLVTYGRSDNFWQVIRNSGFIISTILLKISFKAEFQTSMGLMIASMLFGVIILWLYRRN